MAPHSTEPTWEKVPFVKPYEGKCLERFLKDVAIKHHGGMPWEP